MCGIHLTVSWIHLATSRIHLSLSSIKLPICCIIKFSSCHTWEVTCTRLFSCNKLTHRSISRRSLSLKLTSCRIIIIIHWQSIRLSNRCLVLSNTSELSDTLIIHDASISQPAIVVRSLLHVMNQIKLILTISLVRHLFHNYALRNE